MASIHFADTGKEWTCRDLRKSTLDTVFNTSLLVLIILSYLPQIRLILGRRSLCGISQAYLLCGYIFTAMQFASTVMEMSYGNPVIGCIADGKLAGVAAWSAILGGLQHTVLWLGSASMILLFFIYPNGRSLPINSEQVESRLGNAESHTERHRYPKVLLSLCIVHFCLLVLPTLIISIPRPRESFEGLGGVMIIGAYVVYGTPVCLCMVICQFPLQIKAVLSHPLRGQDSSMSLPTLGMQTVLFVLLGISQKLRFGQRRYPYAWFLTNVNPWDPRHLWDEYRMGPFLYVDDIIFGIGQGLLLLAALWTSRHNRLRNRSPRRSDETEPLLSSPHGNVEAN